MQLSEIVKVLKKVCGKKSQSLYVNGHIEAATPKGNLIKFATQLDCDVSVQLTVEDWELISKVASPVIRQLPDGSSGVSVKNSSGYSLELTNYVPPTRESQTPPQTSNINALVPFAYFDRSLLWSVNEDYARSSLDFVHTSKTHVFTTNGHVLTAIKSSHNSKSVPTELLATVLAIIPKKVTQPEVYLSESESHDFYTMGDMTYIHNKSNTSNPPQVEKFLSPQPESVSIEIDSGKLKDVLKSAKALKLDGLSCTVTVQENLLRLAFHSRNNDARQEFELPVVCNASPTPLVISPSYLLGALEAFSDNKLTVHIQPNNLGPVLFTNPDNQKTVIVMPMRA